MIAGRPVGEEEYDNLRRQIDFHLVWSACFYIRRFKEKWVSAHTETHNFLLDNESASISFAANPVI